MSIVSSLRAQVQELNLKLANANNKIAELEGRTVGVKGTTKKIAPIVEPFEKKVDPPKSFG